MKHLFLILCFPFFLMADINEEYSELFSSYLSEENFDKCEEILDAWEGYRETEPGQITALRASLLLCEGEIEEGKSLLEKALNNIPDSCLSDSMKSVIKKMIEQSPSLPLASKGISSPHIILCKRKQPKGVSFRYWFGVAQVVVGCVVAPFNPAVGGGLIATGIGTVVNAGADCMDNMEKWEKEAQERQRMGTENTSYVPTIRMNYCTGIVSA